MEEDLDMTRGLVGAAREETCTGESALREALWGVPYVYVCSASSRSTLNFNCGFGIYTADTDVDGSL